MMPTRDGNLVLACSGVNRPTPPAPTPEEDRQLLREIGRKVVEDCQRPTQTNYSVLHMT